MMRGGGIYGESFAIKAIVFFIAAGLHVAIAAPYFLDMSNLGMTESSVVTLHMNLQEIKLVTPENPGENAVTIPEQKKAQPVKKADIKPKEQPRKPEKPVTNTPQIEVAAIRPPLPLHKPLLKLGPAASSNSAEPETLEKKTTKIKQKAEETAKKEREIPASPVEEAADQKLQQAQSSAATAISMGRQQASPAEQENYAALLQRHISRHLPEGDGLTGQTVIVFSISQEGRLLSLKVSQPSQTPKVDQLALATIRDAAPYPRPPANSTDAQRTFSMPFDFRQIR